MPTVHAAERYEVEVKGRKCVCLFVCGRTSLKAPGRAVTYSALKKSISSLPD